MDDLDIVKRINQLADEENQLESAHSHGGGEPPEEEIRRKRDIEVALDQCWDLLRQRRARRNAGLDPDEAEVRSESTVETYLQ